MTKMAKTEVLQRLSRKEIFQLLTVDDLREIDDTIYRISGGHTWAKCSTAFWRDVLEELQKDK